MTTAEAIKLLQLQDYTLPARKAQLPPAFAAELRPALAQLEGPALMIAVGCLEADRKSPEAAATLLAIVALNQPQPAAAAAQALESFAVLPPAKDLVMTLATSGSDAARASLYFCVGKSGDANQLDTLRALHRNEANDVTRGHGQAACVRLGGKPERAAFLARIAAADVESVYPIRDEMIHVGDPRLARATLGWLDNVEPIARLGGDRAGQRYARLQDFAVWIARDLNVPDVPREPPGLNAFDNMTLHLTKVAIGRLPPENA